MRARVGVLSDTHGLLRPEAVQALKGVDWIVHAGDLGSAEVLEALRGIAPTVAVRGNIDRGEWAQGLPSTEILEVGPYALYVLHDLRELVLDPAAAGFAVVISGHSHRPAIRQEKGVLYLNPGSVGPRRFDLPVSMAEIRVGKGRLEPRLIELPLRL
ncbi:metallophosphoesterase family protein [Meiothermus granaticius]|uniref:Phosphoesterase n=1 Tax=Meiothermus granaticius NBRC 107808 TaxID=1227551 RepID=A0A399FE22_9DEIN|nr:metallophosphoesterase family protein [Meiothermus granaticius]RIH94055.1 phosphodiesterase [Meiothermus granaticius NBRC 107808]